jgi:hypothetical protein
MILLHINNKEKLEKVTKLSETLGHKVRTFGNDEYDMMLVQLVKGEKPTGKPKLPPLYVMPDVIIFSGLTDEELDDFLDAYRKEGIPETRLKAMITPFNLMVRLSQLLDEWRLEGL